MATIQEKNPHKSLVEVRNTIQVVIDCSRKEAADIANNLNHSQCDAIVKADGDKAKVEAAIKPVVEAKPEKVEDKPKATKGK